jgi:hypothetical protein
VDEVCLRFEKAWQAAQRRPRLEEFLATATDAARPALFRELLAPELAYRLRLGETPAAADRAATPVLPKPPPVLQEAALGRRQVGRVEDQRRGDRRD